MDVLDLNDNTIQEYYTKKKNEVKTWLYAFIDKLPRIKPDQKNKLTEYADNISVDAARELDDYAQSLPTISKKAKKQLDTYIYSIDWLPKGVNVGYADGEIISRIQSSAELDAILAAAFAPIDNDKQ